MSHACDNNLQIFFLFSWRNNPHPHPHPHPHPSASQPPHCRGFKIKLRHTTLGGALLDELSAQRRDLYLKTQNTQKQTGTHSLAGIRTSNPRNRAAADPRHGNGIVCQQSPTNDTKRREAVLATKLHSRHKGGNSLFHTLSATTYPPTRARDIIAQVNSTERETSVLHTCSTTAA